VSPNFDSCRPQGPSVDSTSGLRIIRPESPARADDTMSLPSGVRTLLPKMLRVLTIGTLLSIGAAPLSYAQTWAPPVGIPHPGGWFLAAGNVQDVTSGGTSRTFTGNGTAAAPVVFRGVGDPTFTGQVTISGSYVIVDGIVVDGGIVRFSGNHLALRNSEVKNNTGEHSKTTVSTSGGSSDLVVFRNLIHDNGAWQSTAENDFHGVSASGPLQRYWILENEMYHHGGDSVQVGHGQGNSIVGVYIGRNVMHHDRENAVDLKEVSNSVVSENVMYGYRDTSSSEGAAVVIHYCPVQASVVNNLIYDSQVGISTSSLNSTCSGISITNRIVGNVIHSILGRAVQGWGSGKVTQIANNTFHSIAGGAIDLTNAASGSVIENNIFSSVSGGLITASGVTQRNNLSSGNMLFVNVGNLDFRLQASSPAVNAGASSSVFSGFQSAYGISIARDRHGQPRPSGSSFDIGAYEYAEGTATTTPEPPTNLVAH
jgi:hypothetical protein